MQMFTPTYDSNPFPGFPSSSSSYPLLPFLNPESTSANTNFLLHDPLAVHIMPTNHAPIPEIVTNLAVADCAAMPKQNANCAHFGISNFLTQKPSKKDRHSKIYTSQGLRDRRVRLSIEIARKFFDLQDMLGFDKASNTLEWLFTKSKKAIKELARSKNRSSAGAKSFSSSSECEVVSGINQVTDIPNLQRVDSNDQSLVGGELAAKERKLKRAQKESACARAKKESRTKARARARERTSYKMCTPTSAATGRVHDLKKRFPATTNSQIQHQLRSPIQPEAGSRSPNPVQPHPHLVGKETSRDDFDVIEESIVIKRKLKPSLMSSYPQNLVIPREESFSNSEYSSFPNSSPNWDTSSAIGRSNFCAIASTNLSTELQIFGKSWEECNNQRLH